ncbi:hypothetical protein Murru_1688 [Allomuricauda ruestringensis DSM 13258]|uniref:DUF8202 domain-containing protein n=1 Tax=Allomuricauda ruestringensis (strain DSM 13258 / CIP 107369 / LMG 19739 / B1) TaxID=886377 RepID=G2PIL4_ALLRU|nr:T9SS type B sorting domain-containing protein [Allomuricauda ruestringensis]AEM70728.1 hypothetical protein Murru_1688 [Allomuricauda ruestringensis DSM 13258]
MTKLLLLFFFQQESVKKDFSALFSDLLKHALQCIIILCIFIINNDSFGQAGDVDTWFKAGRAVNMAPGNNLFWDSNPLPPPDGTPVSIWYDLVTYTEQNAVQNPVPANYPLPSPDGFDYPYPNSGTYSLFLSPTGSTPGLPVLHRNNTDNINFNPVVRFDGSGDGQALHFRSNSRDDLTVFIVFKAEGAGNSAESQRLLFGGDVDVHHTSFNQSEWTTNLSLGIADGNRFSVGRTWSGDGGGYFQSGSVDLMGQPTIGVFTREVLNPEEELLTTFVNGIPDISTPRFDNNLADNSLFFYNRLGKHFNSNDPNRNLTGDIAEILLADVSLSNNYIQRVETYLAIKYGITLYNGGQLGSITGNDSYNYLAANGDIIWQAEITYKHDIAGIGADVFNDLAHIDVSLRYTLDQRISKSENSDAIVTISTNTDFSEDNVDPASRPAIPGWPTYNYNYLLWANDNGSINEIFTELPTDPAGITSRIEREWRVQSNQLGGVTPISGVSVRVDLSGSSILTNNDACAIKLLIDTDTDGDFTTGTITEIVATSIDGDGNAYFDNLTLNHREVFTIGYGAPTIDALATQPTTCGASDGEIQFTFQNVPDDSYTITYDGGSFPNVAVAGNAATVTGLAAGNYSNLKVTVNSCTSQQDPDIVLSSPDAPTIDALATQPTTCGASDGEIQFTFQNVPDDSYTITYDGGSFPNVAVAGNAATVTGLAAGNYSNLKITVNSCTSQQDPDIVLSSPDAPTIDALATQPTTCGASDGEIQFTFQNVPDDSYTITYDGGSFPNVAVAGNAATVTGLAAGNYSNLKITVNSCTSQQGPDVVLSSTGFNVTTNVQHETCWENDNGSVSVDIGNAVFPVTVQLNNREPIVFNTNSFDIDDLTPGNYEMIVIDDTGCQTTTSFGIQSGGPNLGASVEVMYLCDSNLPSNTIAITLFDPSISNDVLYALDSTDPNDFVLSPNFGNITSGNHTLSIMHNNGCLTEIPFEVENFEQLELTLTSEYVNQITANVTGGTAPYTYYFDDNEGTTSNTYTIDRGGAFSARVVDSNGCEVVQSTSMNLVDISIPDFFTPNNDGQNDYWNPKNTELFPDIETYIFDRYGRKIKVMGQSEEWNGEYDSKAMPSGDYWYIVKLNDGSGREFVGHFTLYR